MFRRMWSRKSNSSGTFQITVHKPKKADRDYVFSLHIRTPNKTESTIKLGIRNASFSIPHATLWDTFYPLMFIIRNGGPLFRIDGAKAVIKFDYPASRAVVDFFVERARLMDICIDVVSTTCCYLVAVRIAACFWA